MANVSVAWMMPIFCTAGIGGKNTYFSNMRVPIDNESLMFYRLRWSYDAIPQPEMDEYKHGEYFYPALIPALEDQGTTSQRLQHRPRNSEELHLHRHPHVPAAGHRDDGEPVGPDRGPTQEHLTSSDYQIIHIRRRLLKAAEAAGGRARACRALAPGGLPLPPHNGRRGYRAGSAAPGARKGLLNPTRTRAAEGGYQGLT